MFLSLACLAWSFADIAASKVTPNAVGQIISAIAILAAFLFWVWMYRDMTNNDTLPRDIKAKWTQWFFLFNVFMAIWYYFNEYRRK